MFLVSQFSLSQKKNQDDELLESFHYFSIKQHVFKSIIVSVVERIHQH